MKVLTVLRRQTFGIWGVCILTCIGSSAQNYTTLATFAAHNGSSAQGTLVQGTDGNLWGTTVYGGTKNSGTLFKLTPSGQLTTLHSFDRTGGEAPFAGMDLGTNGSFYGVTTGGGSSLYYGTVFNLTSSGIFTVLHNFATSGGFYPYANLTQGRDGNFYGSTYQGGAHGAGTIFKISATGVLTTIHDFDNAHGAFPVAGLVQGFDGMFYGSTIGGGAKGVGVFFKINPSGAGFTVLHDLVYADGLYPSSQLIQAPNGNFYGVSQSGGPGYSQGTFFELTLGGKYTLLHSFVNPTQGEYPSGLTLGTDGNFYGTTLLGGSTPYYGTIFRITPAGNLTVLFNFSESVGAKPYAGLIQHTNGRFYGTTTYGGASGNGTVFSIDVGLVPFVRIVPSSAKAGTTIGILGANLSGATSVTFNGQLSSFTVRSNSYIQTTVPATATTGIVRVVTPTGTLASNVNFHVTP